MRVFNKQTGELEKQFLAYNEHFRGGVRLATADVNQDVLDDELAEEESVPRDELAEASDHWPFDDGEEEAVSTEEPDDFEHESDGLVRAPVPSASMEESGLLRVERMVV